MNKMNGGFPKEKNMIKKDLYAGNKQGECVNYGFNCFNCSHWNSTSNICDMIKKLYTTTTSTSLNQNEKEYKHSINVENDKLKLYFATDDEKLFNKVMYCIGSRCKEWWI